MDLETSDHSTLDCMTPGNPLASPTVGRSIGDCCFPRHSRNRSQFGELPVFPFGTNRTIGPMRAQQPPKLKLIFVHNTRTNLAWGHDQQVSTPYNARTGSALHKALPPTSNPAEIAETCFPVRQTRGLPRETSMSMCHSCASAHKTTVFVPSSKGAALTQIAKITEHMWTKRHGQQTRTKLT